MHLTTFRWMDGWAGTAQTPFSPKGKQHLRISRQAQTDIAIADPISPAHNDNGNDNGHGSSIALTGAMSVRNYMRCGLGLG